MFHGTLGGESYHRQCRIKVNMEQAVNTVHIICCILKHLGVKNIEKYKE
jgi:hypothetical protein